MPKAEAFLTKFLLVLVLIFAFGLVQLFQWRFEAGDVYPQYSSLRTDPLGAKALFESFQAIPGLSVTRNYQPIEHLKPAASTIFYLGVPSRSVKTVDLAEFDKLTGAGARLVLGLLPVTERPAGESSNRVELKPWGLTIAFAEPVPHKPSNLLYFLPSKDWHIERSSSGRAILIDRPFAKGSLVLAADSYPMSNQALLYDRNPTLLSWIAGPNRRLIFEETHFGVTETGSVAALGRRYHLGPFAAALLLLAVLFIWKNSMPLVPQGAASDAPALAAERNSQSWGIPHYLLRRAAPPSELISACLDEWRKSLSLGPKCSNEKLRRVEEAAHSERDPVKAYQAIGRALTGDK